ncbi:amino acid transporter [Dendrothele bispora CBS 962.96]|uniref:Amino acid transporter n=1 Tax=Dendrothele bispora (strain CBS 962.96) TaxID=1314807 RepID=A0A4S8MP76_DENBC|nr:amino acid transporter [Dendrothele bispora CBS 962.96]
MPSIGQSTSNTPANDSLGESRWNNDKDLLAQLGYKEEFKRDFSRWELFGLSFTIVGVVQSIAAVLLFAVPYGGPVSMIWGWFTCSIFLVFVAMAMAELGSSAPTAGGLYYWTFKFSSQRYRRLLSWLVGYINTASYCTGLASVDWGCATQIMAAAAIHSEGAFVATSGQTYGLYCALLISHAILASLATRIIAKMQLFYVFLNVALVLAVIIALPVSTPRELVNKASYAFGHFENVSGWTDGYAFILSFLAPAWTVGGFDTSVHISEEAKNATRAVPFAIMCATLSGCILGWIVNIVLAFHMGSNLESIIQDPVGQPMATIFANSLGPTGTVAIWAFLVITLYVIGVDFLMAGSRQIFAFSRDHGLPLSGVLYNINSRTGTPVHAVFFCALLSLLLGLISFAGPVAISAVFTMSVACQYIGLVTPMIARFVGGTQFVYGPFNLGALSGFVAFVASAYMIFMIIVLLFPAAPSPSAEDMNYTVVVVGGTILLSLGYYFFPKYGGMYWFTGPVHTIKDVKEEQEIDHDRVEVLNAKN